MWNAAFRCSAWFVLLFAFSFLECRWLCAQNHLWKAGVAKAILTPETEVWLAGYGSKRVPDGKIHELWMKALALEDQNGNRGVLITSDFQGVPKSFSDVVFSDLKRKYQLERHQVMVTFSHNHCGPRLGDDLLDYYPIDSEQERLVKEYTERMQQLMVDLVGDAIRELSPVLIHTGQGQTTFAVNRRNNPEAEVSAVLSRGEKLKGPVDHAVPTMTVTKHSGELLAILFGYACHPTTLSFTKWCGDYPGFAQLTIEERHPGALAMFVNTCGGDQNPLPRRSVELCEKYGNMLADAVEQALARPMQPLDSKLISKYDLIELPYLETVSRERLQTAKTAANAIQARWANRLLEQLDQGRVFPATYPYPLHVWRLGNETLFIGMGAEVVVDYALHFKKLLGDQTWVCGYTDDMIAYIPSRRVWEEGGYEGGSNLYEYGRPAFRWAGDIEERITSQVMRLIEQTRE
jgi:hypothetical protein